MATRTATITDVSGVGQPGSAYLITWEGLLDDDVGNAVSMPAWTDRSVQVVGTFDTCTVTLQGSNDGSTWATLTDPQGNPISMTTAGLEAVTEATRYIRPFTVDGEASQDIDVYVFCTGYRVR